MEEADKGWKMCGICLMKFVDDVVDLKLSGHCE